jgi:hypothetical protein
MTMIPLIGPGGLCTREPLPVSGDEPCRTICEPGEQDEIQMRQIKKNPPSNLEKRDTVEGFPYSLLHICECGWPGCRAVSKLGRAPILLDKVQLAMVLWVEVANVPAAFDKFL